MRSVAATDKKRSLRQNPAPPARAGIALQVLAAGRHRIHAGGNPLEQSGFAAAILSHQERHRRRKLQRPGRARTSGAPGKPREVDAASGRRRRDDRNTIVNRRRINMRWRWVNLSLAPGRWHHAMRGGVASAESATAKRKTRPARGTGRAGPRRASAELIAVIVAVTDGEPRVLTIDKAAPCPPARLNPPTARCRPACARGWNSRPTIRSGYVEQLYTFADRDRTATGQRAVSISYSG